MSRIGQTFEELRNKGKKALIPFITAGYPDLQTTEALIYEMERCGADLIELGVPFSDPMADGPVIQFSSERALAQGTKTRTILKLVKKIRRKTSIPIILMGYYNPFLAYDLKRFADDAHTAGVDGILVVDLPPEEASEMKVQTDRRGLDLIFLLAPTSDDRRIKRIVQSASGFIYYVSLTGVTGIRSQLDKDIPRQVEKIKRIASMPVGVGFGISTPLHAKKVAKWADAVVVGSAIIKIIKDNITTNCMIQEVGHFVLSLRKAIDS